MISARDYLEVGRVLMTEEKAKRGAMMRRVR